METAVLNILTNQLTHVLKDSLPKISTIWWESLVIKKLTFQQQSFARQYNPVLHGISPDELLTQQKRTEQPEESVPNPDRRHKGVLERSENALIKESVIREGFPFSPVSVMPLLKLKLSSRQIHQC